MKLFILVALFASVLAVGEWTDVEIDRDDVVEAANQAAYLIGGKFLSQYHSKLQHVLKARSQLVAGMNYHLHLIIGLTTCKKAEVDYENIKDCEFRKDINTYRSCEARLWRKLSGEYELRSYGCVLTSAD